MKRRKKMRIAANICTLVIMVIHLAGWIFRHPNDMTCVLYAVAYLAVLGAADLMIWLTGRPPSKWKRFLLAANILTLTAMVIYLAVVIYIFTRRFQAFPWWANLFLGLFFIIPMDIVDFIAWLICRKRSGTSRPASCDLG